MKIAFVYDRVNKMGGAERVLMALHEIWPEAPLYTAVYDKKGAPWAKDFVVIPSFLQKIPFAKQHHELFFGLMPYAFESFNFDKFDLVISVTSAEAKGIITKPKTCHICYCLTPTRYLWSQHSQYANSLDKGIAERIYKPLYEKEMSKLRCWDQIGATRPDYYLAISREVALRVKKYYHRESTVLYPPVDESIFYPPKNLPEKGQYFLIVSRLVPYKKIDIAIKAFNDLGLPLKIIGTGLEENFLKSLAHKNIEFITEKLTDNELIGYYQRCRALIFPSLEDFGLTPLEAQLCGKPVIAFREGGALETVKGGVTGEFFFPQTPSALMEKIRLFNDDKYDPHECHEWAVRFSKQVFKEKMQKEVERLYNEYHTNR